MALSFALAFPIADDLENIFSLFVLQDTPFLPSWHERDSALWCFKSLNVRRCLNYRIATQYYPLYFSRPPSQSQRWWVGAWTDKYTPSLATLADTDVYLLSYRANQPT